MKIKLRELNIAKLIIKLCKRLTAKQSLNFNNFIIIFNNNNIISIN